MPILPSSTFRIHPILSKVRSSSNFTVPANARCVICISACSSAMRWDNLICCPARNSITSNVVSNYNPVANSCATSGISGYAMTSLLGIRAPFPHTVSLVNATSSVAYASEMRVTTSQVASLTKPFPF